MNEKITHTINLIVIFLVIAVAPLTTVIVIMRNQNHIIYEKRALIFHSNITEFAGIPKSSYIDIDNIYNQLSLLGYNTTWYYDEFMIYDFELIEIIKQESKISEQLVIIIATHGTYYDGNYYQRFHDEDSSSTLIMDSITKKTNTFIYSCGCGSGYFAENYEIPSNWIIMSTVWHGLDSGYGNGTTDEDSSIILDATIIWPAIEAFVTAMKNHSAVELIYSEHLTFLENHYLGTDYFSWLNAPQLWDGDPANVWRL